MTIDDLFALSVLGDVSVSPDGRWIAATITRPGSPSGCVLCNYHERGDVWLIDCHTGARRDLTGGAGDASGSWSATWSPDSRRLALVSTKPQGGEPRGGDNVRLHVWDMADDELTRVSERGIHLQVTFLLRDESTTSCAWLDATTLLAVTLPAGADAAEQMQYWRRGRADAMRAWERGRDEDDPTASVLESRGASPAALPTASLQRIDIVRGTTETLAELPNWDLMDLNSGMQIAVAPNLHAAAVLAVTGSVEQRAERKIGDAWWTHQVGVVALDQAAPVKWAATGAWGEGVAGQLLGWSPDSAAVAVLQQVEPWGRVRRRITLVVAAADATVRNLTPDGMTIGGALWTAGGHLVARARLLGGGDPAAPRRPERSDWFWLDAPDGPVNLTASMPSAPAQLYPTAAPGRLLGIADGAFWAIDAARDAPFALTAAVLPPGAAILRQATPRAGEPNGAAVLVQAAGAGGTALTRFTLHDTGATHEPASVAIAPPTSTARLVAADPQLRLLAFSDDADGGVFVWTTDGEGKDARQRLALNEHVAGIAQGRRMLFPYRGAEGDALQGLALLPPDYQEGRKYPTVVWVYGGLVIQDTKIARVGKTHAGTFNMELLAARGYVVLFPSMPLPFGQKSDPWIDMPKGVLSAVDELIDQGIADPNRLAVMGHSFGGYSTYAIVTYTNRFKAAVAMAGHPDLLSLYGQFWPAERYSDRAHQGMSTVWMHEAGAFNMGGSPWDDLWHYVRNTPLFYLDRVRTPLMIVHGDMDGAPIQQGEEAFTGLHRLGRRARFVRYWGEGHVIASRGNVRHLWGQIFEWLELHLGR